MILGTVLGKVLGTVRVAGGGEGEGFPRVPGERTQKKNEAVEGTRPTEAGVKPGVFVSRGENR